ncbi:unnamed protein product [Calypogeia fissa]
MQHPSPAISSPSTGFLGPRASPLFNSSLDQNIDGGVISSSDLLGPSVVVTRAPQDQDQQAPPKRLSRAMESLGQAHRLIADVRSGADLILEALEAAVVRRGREPVDERTSNGVAAAAEATKLSIEALRTVGRELESSGILRGAQQRYEDNQPWGLQPPSVCPDGLITPYAWKRQIAGQAAASAVERTRLALKAFGEQKKRFFSVVGEDGHGSKRARAGMGEGPLDDASLANVLRRIQSDAPGMAVTPFVRLEWGKRTSSINLSKAISDPSQALASLSSQSLSPVKLEPGTSPTPPGATATISTAKLNEKVAVLEVTISGVLRAIISLHPMGSVYPDALSVFSPDEFGGYVHAWGVSQHKLHQKNSEHGVNALHYFRRQGHATALEHLLHWIYSYRSLFTDPCNVCKRMTALDSPSDLLLPPLVRLYHLKVPKAIAASVKSETPKKEGELAAFHVGCVPKEELKCF